MSHASPPRPKAAAAAASASAGHTPLQAASMMTTGRIPLHPPAASATTTPRPTSAAARKIIPGPQAPVRTASDPSKLPSSSSSGVKSALARTAPVAPAPVKTIPVVAAAAAAVPSKTSILPHRRSSSSNSTAMAAALASALVSAVGDSAATGAGTSGGRGGAKPKAGPKDPPVSFILNQQPVTTSAPRSTLLIDWLHSNKLVGTKLGCGQGGCGACTVNVTFPDQPGVVRAVNSCLKPIGLLDGVNVTTIEGLPHSDQMRANASLGGKAAPSCDHHKNTGSCGGCAHASTCGHSTSKGAPRQSHKSAATAECELHPSGGEHSSCASPTHPEASMLVLDGSVNAVRSGRQSKVAPAQAGDVPDPSDVLASFNGTQCGFCSVGMVMTMNQQLVSIPVAGAPPPSERDIEDLFAGNICRCTGYRPILCGFKSAYAASGNVDELAQTPALVQDESVGYANGFVRSPHVDVIDYKIPPHEGLQKAAPMSLMSLKGPPAPSAHNWPTPPTSWSDLVAQLQSNKLPQPVKLVVGNTSYGVFPSLEWQGVGSFLDMRSLPGVSEISYLPLSYALVPGADKEVVARLEKVQKAFTKAKEELGSKVIFGSWLELGAAVTIQQLMDYLSGSLPMCSQLARRLLKHWKRVAGHQVRNAGSLVGSLCMARFWNFASDTWLLLEALGVFITLTDLRTGIDLIMQLDCFRNLNHVPFVIKNIWIPLVEDSSVQPAANSWFSSYRVAQRLQNAHPLVNFAGSWDGTGLPILVWGNILPAPQDPAQRPVPKVSGTGHYRLSHKLCKTILVAAQNQWANNGLASVQHSVAAELNSVVGSWPAPPAYSEQGDPSIRVQIATNLLLKFLVQAMGAPAAADSSSTIYEQRTATASAGSQKFLVNRSEEPVSEPMVKSSAKEQTRGQTQYASSFRPPNCYHATFVTSWASCGVIAKDSYGAPSLSDAVAWVNAQYGMDLDVAEFTLVDPTDEQFAASNLINGANYIYAPQNYPAPKVSLAWPTAPIFQNTPCYVVAQHQIQYMGQPIALLAGPEERAVTLVATRLGTSDAGYLRIAAFPPIKPILDVQASMDAKTMLVDGQFLTSTELVNTALYMPVGSTPNEKFQSYGSISNLEDGGVPDFTPYINNPDYIVVSGDHEVPGQQHWYMETQTAVAMPPSSTEPAYAKAPLAQRRKFPSSNGAVAPVPDQSLDPMAAATKEQQAQLLPPKKLDPSVFMTIYSATQCLEQVQGECTMTLNASWDKDEHAVQLIAPPLGGGFGGKTVQSTYVAKAAAFLSRRLNKVAANSSSGRAVRFTLARDADCLVIGGRHPMRGVYKAAIERKTGKIVAMEVEVHLDAGASFDCTLAVGNTCLITSDSYVVPSTGPTTGFSIASRSWFTNKASSTAMRSFGIVQSQHFVEMAMQRAAELLDGSLSGFLFRQLNLYPYSEGPVFPQTPYFQDVKYASMDSIWDEMDEMLAQTVFKIPQLARAVKELNMNPADAKTFTDQPRPRESVRSNGKGYDALMQAVHAYNNNSSHLKLGLSVLPLKYGVAYDVIKLNLGEALISIGVDGTCTVHASGVEMGQGLETKMKQIAALKLGIWTKNVAYECNVNSKWFQGMSPNGWMLPGTGASTGADLNGGAVALAATSVLTWIESHLGKTALWQQYLQNGKRFYVPPTYDEQGRQLTSGSNLWPTAVALLNQMNALPLQNSGLEFYESPAMVQLPMGFGPKKGRIAWYYNFAAAGVVSMIDTHTGESCVLCANIIYDSGISLNPAIDIGQCEGGFVQGIGFNTTEELTYDQTTGAFTSINTWLYKPPSTLEIPLQLNIRLWPLAGQVRAWQEEEKKLSGGEDAPSTGLATRLALPSKDNKFRKHWMRIDPSGNLIDPYGVQSSKASGEPPLVLGNAVWYAIRAAVQYARWQRYTAAGRGVTLYQTDAELLCPATTFNTFAAINAPLLSDEELAAYHAGTLSDDKQQRKKLRVPDIEHDPFVMAHIPQPPGGGLASVVPAPSVEHKK